MSLPTDASATDANRPPQHPFGLPIPPLGTVSGAAAAAALLSPARPHRATEKCRLYGGRRAAAELADGERIDRSGTRAPRDDCTRSARSTLRSRRAPDFNSITPISVFDRPSWRSVVVTPSFARCDIRWRPAVRHRPLRSPVVRHQLVLRTPFCFVFLTDIFFYVPVFSSFHTRPPSLTVRCLFSFRRSPRFEYYTRRIRPARVRRRYTTVTTLLPKCIMPMLRAIQLVLAVGLLRFAHCESVFDSRAVDQGNVFYSHKKQT